MYGAQRRTEGATTTVGLVMMLVRLVLLQGLSHVAVNAAHTGQHRVGCGRIRVIVMLIVRGRRINRRSRRHSVPIIGRIFHFRIEIDDQIRIGGAVIVVIDGAVVRMMLIYLLHMQFFVDLLLLVHMMLLLRHNLMMLLMEMILMVVLLLLLVLLTVMQMMKRLLMMPERVHHVMVGRGGVHVMMLHNVHWLQRCDRHDCRLRGVIVIMIDDRSVVVEMTALFAVQVLMMQCCTGAG